MGDIKYQQKVLGVFAFIRLADKYWKRRVTSFSLVQVTRQGFPLNSLSTIFAVYLSPSQDHYNKDVLKEKLYSKPTSIIPCVPLPMYLSNTIITAVLLVGSWVVGGWTGQVVSTGPARWVDGWGGSGAWVTGGWVRGYDAGPTTVAVLRPLVRSSCCEYSR